MTIFFENESQLLTFYSKGENSPATNTHIRLISVSLGLTQQQFGLSQGLLHAYQLDKSSYVAVAAVMVPCTLTEVSDFISD